ncbi:MAG: type II toxin-antitoxin system PemK/MazF family toxin [Dehalococcoidia bacterium]
MPNTTSYSRGDVVLVPFPFTDLSGQKKRPAVVVSSNTYNQSQDDLVLAQLSSQVSRPVPTDEYLLTGWQQANLLHPSVVRPKLFTIDSSLIIRALGQLSAIDMAGLDSRLRLILHL